MRLQRLCRPPIFARQAIASQPRKWMRLLSWQQLSQFQLEMPTVCQQRWVQTSQSVWDDDDDDDHEGSYFGELSDETGEWEPLRKHLETFQSEKMFGDITLSGLIRVDIQGARRLFRTVLQQKYYADMNMWNKWGTLVRISSN
jgi:hypothetical protein